MSVLHLPALGQGAISSHLSGRSAEITLGEFLNRFKEKRNGKASYKNDGIFKYLHPIN